ncbi:hypothetical protein MPSEU_000258900 [Mayamaea pseudoterrestris]|nr:hypothetical protein MPSEU_000258900 [Mayamaea pseudoterrestris]
MSSVYVSEPPTSGKVIFETTHGPLEIQLWCPGTMRQSEIAGGDKSTASTASNLRMKEYREAIQADHALDRRKLELHSRIRFNHRGQVSMALAIDDQEDAEDLQPQFFITLEESKNLDGKYVLFGTISGPTYFNAARIGSLDVDPETNQPVDLEHAPRILSAKIVDNPMHQDLVPQQKVPWRAPKDASDASRRKKKRMGKFDKNVLSFGDELDDVLLPSNNTRENTHANDGEDMSKGVAPLDGDALQMPFASDLKSTQNQLPESKDDSRNSQCQVVSSTGVEQETEKAMSLQFSSSSHRHVVPPTKASADSKEKPMHPKHKEETGSVLEMRNAKYRILKTSKKDREGDTLSKLFAFKSKVKGELAGSSSNQHEDNSLAARMARRAEASGTLERNTCAVYHGQVLESDDDEGPGNKNDGWLKTTFKCKRHIDHTAGGDGRNMDDYEVVDPSHTNDNNLDDEDADVHRHHHANRQVRHHKHHKKQKSQR